MRRSALLRHQYIIRNEPNLQKIVIASTILHLLFVSLIAVPLTSRQKEFRSYFVNIVGPIEIETPAVGTTSSAEEKSEALQTSQKTVAAKPKADVSLESVERVSKEIERLRAIEKLSALKKLREKAQKVQIIEKKGIGKSFYGQEVGGDTDSYYSIITQKIWQQWVYPDFKTSGLQAIISIKIDREGKIISQKIEKTSGDALFDRSAMKAISKASPLPPPPIEMEIGVRFYL